MATATMTTKGQITIPKAVREALGLATGSKVIFRLQADGSVSMSTEHPRAVDLLGAIPYDGPPISQEQMDAAIADGAASR